MEVHNPLYKNQGIHMITSIFTVDKGVTKVLLVRRKNEPYKEKWSLVGGALYNNEDLDTGVRREIYEKSGIKEINIYPSSVFGKLKRSPEMRMVAVTYIGVIDIDKVEILKETFKTSDAGWFPIDKVPILAYDYNDILNEALITLKEMISSSDILKSLFPNGFTIPEIQRVYETILEKKFDRRNFRKKLLNLGFIEDTNRTKVFEGNKPAKVYKFIENKNVF